MGFWNNFKRGGASQIHPHMQVQLHNGPVGQGALLLEQSRRYQCECQGGDLCRDIVRAHQHLGLALQYPDDGEPVFVWASLTPRIGGGELCALGRATALPGQPQLAGLAPAMATMIRALRKCGAEGISINGFLVPSGNDKQAWYVRCMNRGAAKPDVVDAGSMELMGLAGISSDPYALFAALELEIRSKPV